MVVKEAGVRDDIWSGGRRVIVAAAVAIMLAAGFAAVATAARPNRHPAAEGWLTGSIAGPGGKPSVDQAPSRVAGWVHVLSAAGDVVVLRHVPAGPFNVKVPKGRYQVFTSETSTGVVSTCWPLVNVTIHAGRSTEVRFESHCPEP